MIIRTLVLYNHPLDFPLHVVTRWQAANKADLIPAPIGCLYDSLLDAISDTDATYDELTWLPRHPYDEPQIAGCWLSISESG